MHTQHNIGQDSTSGESTRVKQTLQPRLIPPTPLGFLPLLTGTV